MLSFDKLRKLREYFLRLPHAAVSANLCVSILHSYILKGKPILNFHANGYDDSCSLKVKHSVRTGVLFRSPQNLHSEFSCYGRVRFIVAGMGNLMYTPEIKYLRKDWFSYLVGNTQRRMGSSLSVDTTFRFVFG